MQALEIKLASASPLSILLAGNNLARLLGGLAVTVRISLIAVALSLPLGVLFGLLMTRENRVIKLLSRIYLDFIRIMPQLVLLFLVFFGSARVFGLSLSGEFSAVLVFTLWGTAEMGDLVRGALMSIPKHQYESAAALGLTAGQCSRYVIIPQTLRRLLPLAINLVTRMVKTTSLIVLIGVVEVLKTGQQIIDANRFQYPTAALPIYGVIFLLYFLVCWPVSMLARYLEQRWAV
jgi:amino ABC transporter, permease protein, 3-TM region, his/glu/gln/arg/opine family